MTDKEVMQMALDALVEITAWYPRHLRLKGPLVIEALRTAIARDDEDYEDPMFAYAEKNT